MTQLPINPLIRSKLDKAPLIEATEHEIKMKVWFEKPRNRMLFLRDGLIDTQCFPAFYGAFFVLNLERQLAGDLDEEQLDHFVSILLDNVQIPYLKRCIRRPISKAISRLCCATGARTPAVATSRAGLTNTGGCQAGEGRGRATRDIRSTIS